jgi:nucleolar complex protein 3
MQRLRRQEQIRLQEEERQTGVGKGRKKGKAKAQDVQLSEEESTDMEGASLPSDSEVDDIDFSTDDEQGDSSVRSGSPDRELDHLDQLEKRKKRKELEDEREMMQRKKKKLPTRGAEGWSSGEDVDDEEEEGEEDDEEADSGKDEAAEGIEAEVDKGRTSRVVHEPLPAPLEEESSKRQKMVKPKSTILTGTRFGLTSPFDILSIREKSERVALAREQIARLSTDIINDPEVSLGFIKRLSVFAGPSVESVEDSRKKADVDDAIRASAILSLCAVFVDVLPGYRIRDLTEAEAKEKVNQELARRREWEQGLVKVYRDYLELCERVTRERTELSKVSLKAMCTLVTKATQFNFRTNLLRSLVSYLSRRSWNTGSEDSNNALIEVLKSDNHGEVSLEIVRLLNRMIKEKKFNVNERVLEMLSHLRLKNELQADRRADMTSISRVTDAFDKSLKPKDVRKGKGQHLSKAAVKKMKEVREIQKEMKEADAEVDQEERERHQSETLKLLFVLYFSILKAPVISNGLYISALQGLVIFAHRINVDFFRDLLDVLRLRIRVSLADIDDEEEDEEDDTEEEDKESTVTNRLTALHCIVTSSVGKERRSTST